MLVNTCIPTHLNFQSNLQEKFKIICKVLIMFKGQWNDHSPNYQHQLRVFDTPKEVGHDNSIKEWHKCQY